MAPSRMLVLQDQERLSDWGKVLIRTSTGWWTADDKVQIEKWQKCCGYWQEIGTTFIKTLIFWCTAIALRISGHDAAEVYSPEGHRHAEANPTCEVHKGYCTSYQNSRPISFARLHLSRWTSWALPQCSEIWGSFTRRDSGKSKVPAKQRGSWPKMCWN